VAGFKGCPWCLPPASWGSFGLGSRPSHRSQCCAASPLPVKAFPHPFFFLLWDSVDFVNLVERLSRCFCSPLHGFFFGSSPGSSRDSALGPSLDCQHRFFHSCDLFPLPFVTFRSSFVSSMDPQFNGMERFFRLPFFRLCVYPGCWGSHRPTKHFFSFSF